MLDSPSRIVAVLGCLLMATCAAPPGGSGSGGPGAGEAASGGLAAGEVPESGNGRAGGETQAGSGDGRAGDGTEGGSDNGVSLRRPETGAPADAGPGSPEAGTSPDRMAAASRPGSRDGGGTAGRGAGTPAGAWSLSAGRIVYERHGGDGVELWRYDAGAPAPVRLVGGGADSLRPRWSPGGRRIAYFSDAGGNTDVWVVNADGSGRRRVTEHPAADFDPAWRDDGRLLFTSDRDGEDNIWLLDPESGDLRQLTFHTGGRAGAAVAGPGETIFYSWDGVFSWQTYRFEPGAGDAQRLTPRLTGACNAVWSAAAGRLVYMHGGDLVGTDLRSIPARGGDSVPVVSDEGENQDPEVSEDGTRLVWVSDRFGNWEVFEAAVDGSGERRVSRTSEDERHPDLYLGESEGATESQN